MCAAACARFNFLSIHADHKLVLPPERMYARPDRFPPAPHMDPRALRPVHAGTRALCQLRLVSSESNLTAAGSVNTILVTWTASPLGLDRASQGDLNLGASFTPAAALDVWFYAAHRRKKPEIAPSTTYPPRQMARPPCRFITPFCCARTRVCGRWTMGHVPLRTRVEDGPSRCGSQYAGHSHRRGH